MDSAISQRSLVARVLSRISRAVPPRVRRPALFSRVGRSEPFSRKFGSERGTPICRLYIADFLSAHASDIRGNTLEIADDSYTRKYGGSRVSRGDVLHLSADAPGATIVGDLTKGDNIESNRFDCVILTQTLNVIYDVQSAVRTVHRILKPGGVVLATMPGISQISQYDMNRWGEYWRFTTASAERLFADFANGGTLEVASKGNLPAAVAYLQGLAVEDVGAGKLKHDDADYQLLVTVRAVKGDRASAPAAQIS